MIRIVSLMSSVNAFIFGGEGSRTPVPIREI